MAINKLWIFVAYIFISVCQASCVYNNHKQCYCDKEKKLMLKEKWKKKRTNIKCIVTFCI